MDTLAVGRAMTKAVGLRYDIRSGLLRRSCIRTARYAISHELLFQALPGHIGAVRVLYHQRTLMLYSPRSSTC